MVIKLTNKQKTPKTIKITCTKTYVHNKKIFVHCSAADVSLETVTQLTAPQGANKIDSFDTQRSVQAMLSDKISEANEF